MTLSQKKLANAKSEMELTILYGNEEREMELRRVIAEMQEQENQEELNDKQVRA